MFVCMRVYNVFFIFVCVTIHSIVVYVYMAYMAYMFTYDLLYSKDGSIFILNNFYCIQALNDFFVLFDLCAYKTDKRYIPIEYLLFYNEKWIF